MSKIEEKFNLERLKSNFKLLFKEYKEIIKQINLIYNI